MDSKVVTKAAKSLGLRDIVVYSCEILGTAYYSRMLSPADFGFYAVLRFTISIFSAGIDMGFGGRLIQQQSEPTQSEKQTLFGIQSLLAIVLCLVLVAFSPNIIHSYKLQPEHQAALIMVVLSLGILMPFVSSNMVLFERKLAFDKVGRIEVVQTLAFHICAMVSIQFQKSAAIFGLAMLARMICGAVATAFSLEQFHLPKVSLTDARSRLRFGLAYQASSIVSLVKDAINPIFIGFFLGVAQTGGVAWASMVAGYPGLFMMAVSRLFFPTFSRLLKTPERLAKVVQLTFFCGQAMVAPLSVLTYLLLPQLVERIFGAKWSEFEFLVPILMVGNIFVPLSSPSLALANALGLSRIPLVFSIVWMAITWGFGVFLIPAFGLTGYGLTLCLVHLSNIFLFLSLKKRLPLNYLRPTLTAWIAAIGSGFSARYLTGLLAVAFPVQEIFELLLFCSLYGSTLYVLERAQIAQLFKILIPKKSPDSVHSKNEASLIENE